VVARGVVTLEAWIAMAQVTAGECVAAAAPVRKPRPSGL
jgi:hypothetical protein